MLYLLAVASFAMLGFMFWRVFFRMRADRVRSERELTRGKFTFRPRERVRFLLKRSFVVPEEKPGWEGPLVARLVEAAPPERPAQEPQPAVARTSVDAVTRL